MVCIHDSAVTIGAISEQYNYDNAEKGLILSGFFVGYITIQVLVAWFARRTGGWCVLAATLGVTSLALFLTPFASSSVGGLVAMRILAGIGQSAMYPTMHELLSQWCPRSERSLLVGIAWSGSNAGVAVSLAVSGFIVADHSASFWAGWRGVYFVWGAAGLALAALWLVLGSSSPEQHSWAVSIEERNMILASRDRSDLGLGNVPWRKLLLHPAVFAMVIALMSTNWTIFLLLSWA